MRGRYEPEHRDVCCTECFRDRVIRRKIREESTTGDCPWCGSVGVKVIPIGSLTDVFRELVHEYAVEGTLGSGEALDTLLDDAWEIFSARLIDGDGDLRGELLLGILEHGLHPKEDVDEPDFRSTFVPRVTSAVDLDGVWDERLDQVIGDPGKLDGAAGGSGGATDPYDFIADAVETAGLEFTIRTPHFRARIHKDRGSSHLIPLSEMGAPPASKVRAARANRAGSPVLYVASDKQTALAEVRAWKGAIVAVATMRLSRPARILNLVRIPPPDSPFAFDNLAWWLDARALLRRHGRELARPIIPGEEESEYKPSQHICDVARGAKFDGVAYPSAMGQGHNVVLFDPDAAIPETVAYYRVGRPRFKVEAYPHPEMRWDEA